MSQSLDFVADVDADGKMPRRDSLRVKMNLTTRAGGQVRIRVSEPVRSPVQNSLYWCVLGEISDAYQAAGLDYSAELLHRWYKIRFLPVVAAELLRETGEEVDCVREHRYPNGETDRVYTTTRLSVGAFRAYLERVQAAGEEETGRAKTTVPDKLRSGRIAEPSAS